MFTDGRSKRVIFVAHCLLNQNAISDGTANHPAAHKEEIARILGADVGIVQMPCPELLCLGLDRGNVNGAASPVVVENTRIRAELDKRGPQIEQLAKLVVEQIAQYKLHKFHIAGIVGMNRSPSCGVESTSRDGCEVPGHGVFMAELARQMKERGLAVDLAGIKASDSNALDQLLCPGKL